jgi:xanthine dehydrogenase accessory factor
MSKELEIWEFAAERLRQNEQLMLLIVAASTGSSPGRKGFKMIVAKDELRGSIGGGVMEVNLVEQARALLSVAPAPFLPEEGWPKAGVVGAAGASDSFVTEQVHQKNAQNPSGMICSGKQTVIFYKLDPSHLETVFEIADALEKNEPKVLRVTPDEFRVQASASEEPSKGETQNEGWIQNEEDFLYEEELGHKNRLFIVGGGHCALALSELMSKMDFYISLFDDRPNLNTLDKNKFADEKNIIESYEKIAEVIASGENNYVVVMTLGYKSDELVIRKLLDKEFKYFGVLGSKVKMATLLRDLEKEGFSKEKLASMRTPIGLQINSQTPEEIAVSIAAEIIAVKNSAK